MESPISSDHVRAMILQNFSGILCEKCGFTIHPNEQPYDESICGACKANENPIDSNTNDNQLIHWYQAVKPSK